MPASTIRIAFIVNAIRQRRMSLGYSQEYMAYKMGMGQNCYSKIELGNSKLTVDRLFDIARLLEMEPASLLTIPAEISQFA